MDELILLKPEIRVQDNEYKRLLGLPKNYILEGRTLELANWAREWYSKNGSPWVYAFRTNDVKVKGEKLFINSIEFLSLSLKEQFEKAKVSCAVITLVCAGPELEEKAIQLWKEGKPDEYFFLEVYGSAVVEHLITTTGWRFCDWADKELMSVLPHYSPGYPGWQIEDQIKLFAVINEKMFNKLPSKIDILESGMLKPKKSLLAVFGITNQLDRVNNLREMIPCERCSLSNCIYRRSPYSNSINQIEDVNSLQPKLESGKVIVGKNYDGTVPAAGVLNEKAKYSVSSKALEKWKSNRLKVEILPDSSIKAKFNYEGTTCSNLGRPIKFEYHIKLSSMEDGYQISEMDCCPAGDDNGFEYMCEYISMPDELMESIEREKPLLGRPLNDILNWQRTFSPEGCFCNEDSRMHKWGIALEVLHYALAMQFHESKTANDYLNADKNFDK